MFLLQATSLVNTAKTVNVLDDTCLHDSIEVSASKPSLSLENNPHSPLFNSGLVSNFACPDAAQEVVSEEPDIKILEECNTLVSIASDVAGEKTSPTVGQQAVSADLSIQTTFDSCSNTVPATSVETSDAICTKSSKVVNLTDDAHFAVLTTDPENCLQVTDDIGFVSESNNELFANATYEINPNFDGESEICLMPFLSEEISDLTQKVEKWGFFGKEGEECFPALLDEDCGCVGYDLQAKELPLPLSGDSIEEGKAEQVVDGSTFLDSAVVLDKLDSIISNIMFGEECSFPVPCPDKTLCVDLFSSCSAGNSTKSDLDMQEFADKGFTPIGGSTPHSKLKNQGSNELIHTDWLVPTLHQMGHSDVVSDPQRSDEVAASAKCTRNCGTPVIPSRSRPPKILSLGRRGCSNLLTETLAMVHEAATSVTPISTSEEMTWTTPVMLLNKSVNTSWNLKGKGVRSAKDNSSETDPLFWK